MWLKSKTTTSERCEVKYEIYMCIEPCTFPNVQVSFSNVATKIKFFDNGCVIFLQPFNYIVQVQLYCTSVILKSDSAPQLNALTTDTLLIFRTKKLLEEVPIFPTKCTNFGLRSQSQTSTDNRLFKIHTHRWFRSCHKAFNTEKTKKSFLM